MNPFFFGSSGEPLYGIYHPPREERAVPAAALLCYPLGIEYMRAHRAFRQLTALLTRAGVHVFRFDYFGTGDSAGSAEDASLDRWMADIELACDELRANAGVDHTSIVGLRLGATLAAMTANRIDGVDRVVMWDPIVRGVTYLDELIRYAELPRHARNGDAHPGSAWPPGTVGVGGFPITAEFRAQLAALDLTSLAPPLAPVTMVTSERRPSHEELCRIWRDTGASIEFRCVPSENRWVEGDAFGSALIPQDIIQAIVETFTSGALR